MTRLYLPQMEKAIEHAKPNVQRRHWEFQNSLNSIQEIPFQWMLGILDNWVYVLQQKKDFVNFIEETYI
jgi:hypothetical protein